MVLDTTVLSAELTRRGAPLAASYSHLVEGRHVFISFVTEAELRYGARLAAWGDRRLARLHAQLGRVEVVWSGRGLVEEYVALRLACTRAGHALGQKHHEADRWIAATARWLGVPLVAHDAVFRNAPGVVVLTQLS